MDLRSGTRTGPVAQLSGPAKEGFEEGVAIIFSQWTALVLAVENQWGGSESASKADYLIEDILEWFYKKKEHYADELEMELADALLEEFHVEVEDGSPSQVAKQLVELYAACLRNDASVLQQLRQRQATGAAASKKCVVDLDGAQMDDDSSSSDADSDDDEVDEDMGDAAAPAAVPLKVPQAPVVDADGFELVQKRRGRR